MIKLPPRLQKIADIVLDIVCETKVQAICDVGTDHAYIPIYCIQMGMGGCQHELRNASFRTNFPRTALVVNRGLRPTQSSRLVQRKLAFKNLHSEPVLTAPWRAIACDIADGPLTTARENVDRLGLGEFIEVRKSDGLQAVKEGESGVTVISGMGGETIAGILEHGKWKSEVFVLQPQTKADRLRKSLDSMGFKILQEYFIEDSEKICNIMVVRYYGN
jgi:tRNA A22 N-methylase